MCCSRLEQVKEVCVASSAGIKTKAALNFWELAGRARCWSRAVRWCRKPLFHVALQQLFERDLFPGGPGFEPGKEGIW